MSEDPMTNKDTTRDATECAYCDNFREHGLVPCPTHEDTTGIPEATEEDLKLDLEVMHQNAGGMEHCAGCQVALDGVVRLANHHKQEAEREFNIGTSYHKSAEKYKERNRTLGAALREHHRVDGLNHICLLCVHVLDKAGSDPTTEEKP